MKRHLIRTISLTAVLALFMAAMCASFAFVSAKSFGSAGIFYDNNAENITKKTGEDYLAYRLNGDDNSVTFRRNLALKWFTEKGEATYFSLSVNFLNAKFSTFTVAMETSQFSMSKEEKTTNELTFKNSNGNLTVGVNGDDSDVTVSVNSTVDIVFSADDGNGNFTVKVGGNEVGTFTNIGKYYAKYASASSSKPLMPLTFSAEGVKDGGAEFELRKLNGQEFKVDKDGNVEDNQAPVLVVDSDIRQFYFGTEIDIDAVAIDVCNSSGIVTDEYYYYDGLNAEQDEDDKKATLVVDGKTYAALKSDKIFKKEEFKDWKKAGVSIAYRVKDGSTEDGKEPKYLVDWSALTNDEGLIPVVDANEVTETPKTTFITYTKDGGAINFDPETDRDQAAIDAYQAAVKNASYKNGVEADGSIQVGTGAYYYIPAFKQYIEDSTCGYTDMDFTVYYRVQGSQSVSTVNGSYDELRIELKKEGLYQFRIVPTNSAGKKMAGLFEQGSGYIEKDIATGNVFDAVNLPTFTFRVEYAGAVIEEPEDAEAGYVDAVYSIDDFEIIGIEGYTVNYRLYYFEQKSSEPISLNKLRDADENVHDVDNALGSWKLINEYDSALKDNDKNNDNDYEWKPDSLTFIPKEQGFYKVVAYVSEANIGTKTQAQYIDIGADNDVIPGDTYWLENNVLSLVFLGVGILCLVGIVVVLLIKPKNNAVADAESSRKAELKEKREKRK